MAQCVLEMGVVHMVATSKQLFRDALIGFVLGLVVVSGLTLATWQTRTPPSDNR